jgi:hypothetical protein
MHGVHRSGQCAAGRNPKSLGLESRCEFPRSATADLPCRESRSPEREGNPRSCRRGLRRSVARASHRPHDSDFGSGYRKFDRLGHYITSAAAFARRSAVGAGKNAGRTDYLRTDTSWRSGLGAPCRTGLGPHPHRELGSGILRTDLARSRPINGLHGTVSGTPRSGDRHDYSTNEFLHSLLEAAGIRLPCLVPVGPSRATTRLGATVAPGSMGPARMARMM